MSGRLGMRLGIPLFLALLGAVGFGGILEQSWAVMAGLFIVILVIAHLLIAANLRRMNTPLE
ncbi:MAG: hypothetical protein JOY77_08690 [Alphaproteobacteria bacterium]|nr:hypothetical protein [Alphaproteobacteria bacterium]MBV9062988.1 hypothetical protein [Alphaproteobacteria bacterium]